jgi:hypothetical protein
MTDPIHWKQVETPNIIKFPAHIPEDGIVIKEGNKTFKIHNVVVNLDDTFMVNGKEYSRYSAFEKGQMLSLPLWGSCQIRDFEIFKVPGNWIRLAKMPIATKEKFSYLNDQPLSPNGPFVRPDAPAEFEPRIFSLQESND